MQTRNGEVGVGRRWQLRGSRTIGVGLVMMMAGAGACIQIVPENTQGEVVWLVDTTEEPPGEQCENGGTRIIAGMDDGAGGGVAGDGVLQTGEVQQTQFVCSETPGGVVTIIEDEPPGEFCEFGGKKVSLGTDDGKGGGIAGDGILQPSELDNTVFVCEESHPAPVAVGLPSRPAATACKPVGTSNMQGVALVNPYPNIILDKPVALIQSPLIPGRWFAAEQDGKIRTFTETSPGTPATALDLTSVVYAGFEAGLLNMAFHPTKAQLFVLYTSELNLGPAYEVRIQLVRYSVNPSGAIDPTSATDIYSIQQDTQNQNGGALAFGPDGYLYLGLGDGGTYPPTTPQNLENANGSILRIDVDTPDASTGKPYSIPADNPMLSDTAEPAIFAYGFRDPRQMAFAPDGKLYAGDIGRIAWEEINVITPGGNYGWSVREGDYCRHLDLVSGNSCDSQGLVEPLHSYNHSFGCGVTLAGVYSGSGIAALKDQLIFGDFCQGTLTALDPATGKTRWLLDRFGTIRNFATDSQGELYVLDWVSGAIHKLVDEPASPMPALLSETGCVEPNDPKQPAPGAIPYSLNTQMFGNGAYRTRYLFVPPAKTVFVTPEGEMVLPEGSVTMKHLQVDGNIAETWFLQRHDDGEWSTYAYRWNEAGTDAYLLKEEETTMHHGKEWKSLDRGSCIQCHSVPTGGTIGLETRNLDRVNYYPSTGQWAHQLSTLEAIGLFEFGIPNEAANLVPFVDPNDTSAPLERRARSWLHGNCSFCHRPGGNGFGLADYRYRSDASQLNVCDAQPQATSLGIPNAKIIAPGKANNSILIDRISRTDNYRMHPLQTEVDATGVELMRDWIQNMGACP